jgi:hypothetical protein
MGKNVFYAHAYDGISSDKIIEQESKFKSIVEALGGSIISTNRQKVDPHDKQLRNLTVKNVIDLVLQSDILYVDMSIPDRNYFGCIHEMVEAKNHKIPIIAYVGNTGYENRNHLLFLAEDKVFTSYEDAIACLRKYLQ